MSTMLHAVLPIKNFLKFSVVCTDNNIFRLHYKVTVIMLVISTLLVTTKEFFGEPIHCIHEDEKFVKAINTYCWIYGTYTLRSQLGGIRGRQAAYPGIGPETKGDSDHIKHMYYQWVWVILLVQAAMFYMPHYLWKVWEGGRLKNLTANLVGAIIPKDDKNERRDQLLKYFLRCNQLKHNIYATRFIICEILNLINVIGQMFLLDLFLGGSFLDYGAAVTALKHRPRVPEHNQDIAEVNPMDAFFPKMTKCYLKKYGPSGTIEYKDFLCVLPLNVVNEKIFIVLWFWLLVLAFFSILALLYRVSVLTVPRLRALLIVAQLRDIKRSDVNLIIHNFSYGDWFILHLLGKNLNPNVHQELMLELAESLERKSAYACP